MKLPSLFNLSKPTIIGVVAFLALFVLGLILARCHAATLNAEDAPYVQFSGGAAIVRGATETIDLAFTERAPQLRSAFFEEALTLIGASSYRGVSVPNNFALRGLFLDGFGRFDMGLGVAWTDNPLPYNGQHLNFNLQIDYRFIKLPITLTYTHISDAGSRLPNLGRDLILIGWRFH